MFFWIDYSPFDFHAVRVMGKIKHSPIRCKIWKKTLWNYRHVVIRFCWLHMVPALNCLELLILSNNYFALCETSNSTNLVMQFSGEGFMQKKSGVAKISKTPNKMRHESSRPDARIIAVFQNRTYTNPTRNVNTMPNTLAAKIGFANEYSSVRCFSSK